MRIKPYAKKCDRCKRKSSKKLKIFRLAIHKHFPYYDYFGFDLCEDCLIKFEKKVERFLNGN